MSPIQQSPRRISVRRLVLVALAMVGSHAIAQTVLPDLVVFPTNVRPGTPTKVTVTMKVTDSSYISGSGIVNELTADGHVLRQLGKFVDDGTGGDEVAGDKKYTSQFTFLPGQAPYTTIAGSVAFKGVLQRTASPFQIIWITSDTDPNAPVATLDGTTVVFRDSSGHASGSLLLLQYSETTVTNPTGQSVVTRHDTAMISESQQTVAVITHVTSLDVGSDEGINLPSELRYYKSDGTLQFDIASSAERTFFIDSQNAMMSRSGNRLMVVEVANDETMPSVQVLDNAGQLVRNLGNIAGLTVIRQATLSSNGRYIGLIGDGNTTTDSDYHIVVIDIDTGGITERRAGRSAGLPYPYLAENQTGSFTLVVGAVAPEQLP